MNFYNKNMIGLILQQITKKIINIQQFCITKHFYCGELGKIIFFVWYFYYF